MGEAYTTANDNVATLAAMLCRTYRIKLPDAGIAATAMMRNVPLITRDQQFRKIKEIKVLEI